MAPVSNMSDSDDDVPMLQSKHTEHVPLNRLDEDFDSEEDEDFEDDGEQDDESTLAADEADGDGAVKGDDVALENSSPQKKARTLGDEASQPVIYSTANIASNTCHDVHLP